MEKDLEKIRKEIERLEAEAQKAPKKEFSPEEKKQRDELRKKLMQ